MTSAGCPSFVELVRALCKRTGDEVEVRKYDRLLPLVVSDQALGSYHNIKPGDCVVAFSRRSIFDIKATIERMHPNLKCYVV
jgi:ATP-dependent RNA helicase SUPV3L1/SUV3